MKPSMTGMTTVRTVVLIGTFVFTFVCLSGCETVHSRHEVNVSWLVDQGLITNVAVMEFGWARPVAEKPPRGVAYGHLGDADKVVADAVASSLLKLNRYVIIERSEIKRRVAEHGLELSELLAEGEYQRIGQLTGLDGLIIGHVAIANAAMRGWVVHGEIDFSCRCVSTRTGEIYWSMAGSKSVLYATKLGSWVGILAEELAEALKSKLNNPAIDIRSGS